MYTEKNDALEALTEIFPYEPGQRLLNPKRHLRSGSADIWIPSGGSIDKRPGFSTSGSALPANLRGIWATVSETNTIALVVFDSVSGFYKVYYRKTGGAWTAIADVQLVQQSTTPQEMVWVGSELYVRGTPNANVLGTAVYNETDDSTKTWGAYTPAMVGKSAPVFTASSGWNSSGSDTVTPALGARYAYTWVWASGQESSLSPVSDLSPVVSGKYPAMTLPQTNDSTNIVGINVYRSGDGGGGLYFIESLVFGTDMSYGTGTFTYEDTNFTVGGNFSSGLNFSRPAPTQTSNDPPPTIESGVVLTDYPPQRSSPIAFFRGRLYFAVGRNLFWSVLDEAVPASGLLLHSFRAGSFTDANYATLQDDVIDLHATQDALYVCTKKDIFQLVGELRSELRIRLAFPGIGVYDRRCFTSLGSALYWVDQNRQIRSAVAGGQIPFILSNLLNKEQVIASRRYSLHRVLFDDHIWIVLAIVDESVNTNTKFFIFDAAREFWFAPWNVAADAVWDSFTIAKGTAIGVLDTTVGADLGVNFGCALYFNGFRNPSGNHVNLFRSPAKYSVLEYVRIYYNGSEPTVTVRVDSTSTALATVSSDIMTATSPVGYYRQHYWLQQTGDNFFPIFVVSAGSGLWSLLGLSLVFEPNLGD